MWAFSFSGKIKSMILENSLKKEGNLKELEKFLESLLRVVELSTSIMRKLKDLFLADLSALEDKEDLNETDVIRALEKTINEFSEITSEQKTAILNQLFVGEDNIKELQNKLWRRIESYLGQKVESKNKYLERGLNEAETTDLMQAYAYIVLSPEELVAITEDERKKLTLSFQNLIGRREIVKKHNVWSWFKETLEEAEPTAFAQLFIDSLYNVAEGKEEKLRIKATSFAKLPDVIRKDPNRFGLQKVTDGNYEIAVTLKLVLDALEKYAKIQRHDIETWDKIAKVYPPARGLWATIGGMFTGEVEQERETDKQARLGTELLLKVAEQIVKEAGEAGLSGENLERVKHIVDEVNEIVKIRQEKKPGWDLKIKDKFQGTGKWILENGKAFFGLLGTGALLWGAVFAFYLPVLITDYAEKTVAKLIK